MKKLFTLLAFIGIAAMASAQVTFNVIGGTAGYNTDAVSNLLDGTQNKWCTYKSCYVIFSASEAITMTGYALRTGNDNESNNGRNPKTWKLYGSNNDSNHGENGEWTLIQEKSGDTTMEDYNFQTYYFSIDSNRAPYKYYKLKIEDVQSGDVMQLSEFIPSYETSASKTLTAYAGGQWWDSQPWSFVTDGSSVSTWISGDARNYICMDAGEAIVMTSYSISTGHDTQSQSSRNPVSWTIYGSNTKETSKGGSTWDELVKETDSNQLQAVNSKTFYFDCNNSKSYRYYMLVIDKVVGGELVAGDYSRMCQISGFDINHPQCSHASYSSYSFCSNTSGYQTVSLCDECYHAKREANQYTFNIKDGMAFTNLNAAARGEVIQFNYERTVSSPMGTICLPYELTISGNAYNNADFYTLAKCVNNTLVFDKCSSIVPELTPAIYILKDEYGTSLNLSCHNTGTPATPTQPQTVNDRENDGWAMVGTLKDGSATESGNSIYYVKDGGFKRCTGTINYKPYRAYITGPSGGGSVKAFGIADDMEDAINDIMQAEDGEIHLYDLSGRKVNNIRNGEVYIMNGRKVMFNK